MGPTSDTSGVWQAWRRGPGGARRRSASPSANCSWRPPRRFRRRRQGRSARPHGSRAGHAGPARDVAAPARDAAMMAEMAVALMGARDSSDRMCGTGCSSSPADSAGDAPTISTAMETLPRSPKSVTVASSLALLPASRAHHCFRIMSVANVAHAIRCCTIPARVFGSGR